MDSNRERASRTGKTALTGAAIGSTALAAALLYATRRKEQLERSSAKPQHPQDAPETD